MEAYIVEWLSLLGRWAHMITGIAWIGASFYFVWLDNHLQTPKQASDVEKGVGGELWAVHGGGFYHAQKYKVAPPTLPDTLHWFKWEAYTTWMTGMFLLALLYWYGAEIYTIDPSVMQLSKPVAILIGLATVVVGWLFYDLLCKSPLGKNDKALGLVLFGFVVLVAWSLCQVFSGRGAYMHFGAMLGTIMVANVFFTIMPGQRALVEATQAGQKPDPSHGLKAKQRSVHNTYFTLPVLFVMISNHYAMTYGHEYNWLILIGLSMAGALIRIFFVQRHFGKPSPVPMVAAVLILLLIAVAIAPAPVNSKNGEEVSFGRVQDIIQQRCSACHASVPTQAGFSAAPKGVIFDAAADIQRQAQAIHQQTVVTKAMPIGNLTQMTEEERAAIQGWYLSGANKE